MKITGPYPTMYNRDEIFFRLGIEKSEELLQKIRCAENPNFQDDMGFSYLHRACQAHYLEAIELLLKMGADPNIHDKRGHSPILEAIGSINENNNAILELMLEYGLNLDKMEGGMTLKEQIESFDDDEMNRIISKY
ncbi:MAG: ankyrin repeat domain-containing protein, partial [Oscillospiraceae bacterium]